jgi:hypothetical protein
MRGFLKRRIHRISYLPQNAALNMRGFGRFGHDGSNQRSAVGDQRSAMSAISSQL